VKSEDVAYATVGGLGGVLRSVASASKLLYEEEGLSCFTSAIDAFQSDQTTSFKRQSTLL